MNKLVLVAAVAAVIAGPAFADMKLAQSKNCMACHAVDKKLVGPAYKDVATKYAGNKDAQAMLAAKIKKGGMGAWGQIPMPPNNVTDEEAGKLAAWVLAGAK